MRLRDIAIATITWARTADEEAMLRRSLCRLASIGVPLVVADGSSPKHFTDFLGTLPGVRPVAPPGPGLVPQIVAAVDGCLTLGTRFVLYTEPDKESFFGDRLRDFVDRAPDDDGIGVVIAARTQSAFETFPPMQRYTERVANDLCAPLCGVGDYFYGPFLVARALLPAVSEAPPTLGWGWRPFIFRRARERGWRVVHLEGNYECPLDQREESQADRFHRLRQLQQNIDGLLADPFC